jgi:hypothetical protein
MASIIDKIRQLASKFDLSPEATQKLEGITGMKMEELPPLMREWAENPPMTPMLTRQEGLIKLLSPLKQTGAVPPQGKEELFKLAKVWMTAPRKVRAFLQDIGYDPQLRHRALYRAPTREIFMQPWKSGAGSDIGPSQLLQHELEHTLHDYLMTKQFGKSTSEFYHMAPTKYEALAEWGARQKAKLANLNYIPVHEEWKQGFSANPEDWPEGIRHIYTQYQSFPSEPKNYYRYANEFLKTLFELYK